MEIKEKMYYSVAYDTFKFGVIYFPLECYCCKYVSTDYGAIFYFEINLN